MTSSSFFAYNNPEQSPERQRAIPLSDHENPNDGFDVDRRFDGRHSTHVPRVLI